MPKPKRKLVEIDPDLIKEVEEWERRVTETKIKNAEALARAEETRRWLRLLAEYS